MKRLLYIIGICLAVISCDRRDLTYDYNEYCNVTVNLDWSALSKAPSGMSLYFYPQDGSDPIVKTTNDVDSYVVGLKEGIYNVLIFNLSTIEFGSLSFSGMDSFNDAMVVLTDTKSEWYNTKADEIVSRTPEDLAVKTYENFEITSNIKETTLDVKPLMVISTAVVKIKISGLHNLLSAQGSMSGMSAGYYFASQTTHSSQVTHLLEEWTKEYDEGSTTDGYVTTNYSTFGLPETEVATRVSDDWQGSLWAKLTLIDNQTEIEISTGVTLDNLTVSSIGTTTTTELSLEMGTGSDSDPLEGEITELPDVNAEGSGGFTADVEGWGNSENIIIGI